MEIYTKWDTARGTDVEKRVPATNKVSGTFKFNRATDDGTKDHYELVWEFTDFGANTPMYFIALSIAPIDTSELNDIHNAHKLKNALEQPIIKLHTQSPST